MLEHTCADRCIRGTLSGVADRAAAVAPITHRHPVEGRLEMCCSRNRPLGPARACVHLAWASTCDCLKQPPVANQRGQQRRTPQEGLEAQNLG